MKLFLCEAKTTDRDYDDILAANSPEEAINQFYKMLDEKEIWHTDKIKIDVYEIVSNKKEDISEIFLTNKESSDIVQKITKSFDSYFDKCRDKGTYEIKIYTYDVIDLDYISNKLADNNIVLTNVYKANNNATEISFIKNLQD